MEMLLSGQGTSHHILKLSQVIKALYILFPVWYKLDISCSMII